MQAAAHFPLDCVGVVHSTDRLGVLIEVRVRCGTGVLGADSLVKGALCATPDISVYSKK